MKQMTVEATVPANAEKGVKEMSASVNVDYGETAEESIQMFGGDAVNSNAFANWRVTLQSSIRSALKAGLSVDEIQARLAQAKMGTTIAGVKVDPQQAFIAKFKTATPEKQAEMLEMLRTAAQG